MSSNPMDGSASSSPQLGGHDAATQQMLLEQQQLAQHLQQQQQLAAQHAGRTPVDMATLAAMLQQQQAAMQQAQLQATAQILSLQALGSLTPFTAKGAATGLACMEWLQHAERYFAAREAALGITAAQGDPVRVVLAANALQDDAQRWYNALPLAARPQTWDAFGKELRGRYSSVPAVRMRLDQLRSFVDAARRIRDKMTLEGLHAYTSRFQQLAGEIPSTHLTAHGKLELLARGLSTRLAEAVLTEDAQEVPAPLHEIIRKVTAKAAFKEYAGGASPSNAPSGDAMQLDAISLCATQFGVSRDEAARYLAPGEGWEQHDTSGAPPARAPTASPAGDDAMERLLAAFAARFGGAGSAPGSQGKGQSHRRNVPAGVRADIPEQLAVARKEAGLCIKCGIAKYEPGSKGHHAGTCKAAADKTTSVAEGKKKAGF